MNNIEISISEKLFSYCEYRQDFDKKCRSANSIQFTTILGENIKVIFTDEYGDPRYYFVHNDSINNKLTNNIFVMECEIELFADCFPAIEPLTENDLRMAYNISTPCGTMLPRDVIPEYNKRYISILYAFLIAVFSIPENYFTIKTPFKERSDCRCCVLSCYSWLRCPKYTRGVCRGSSWYQLLSRVKFKAPVKWELYYTYQIVLFS